VIVRSGVLNAFPTSYNVTSGEKKCYSPGADECFSQIGRFNLWLFATKTAGEQAECVEGGCREPCSTLVVGGRNPADGGGSGFLRSRGNVLGGGN